MVTAFLTPLSPGSHTVTIACNLSGDVAMATFHEPYIYEITYTVIVG